MSDYIEPYTYHGFKFYKIDTLLKVLDSGFILPRCMINDESLKDKNNLFNGTKYISLCRKSMIDDRMTGIYRNSFDERVFDNLCVVMDDVTDILYPNLIEWDYLGERELKEILFNDNELRYSYYQDELQTAKPIPITKIIAVGYPKAYFETTFGEEQSNKSLEIIRSELEKHNLDVPIVNSGNYDFADNAECIKKYTLNRK